MVPKRLNHYVPAAYLRSFSLDGRRVWGRDKRSGIIRQVGINDVCCEPRFYEVAGSYGELSYEDDLACSIEPQLVGKGFVDPIEDWARCGSPAQGLQTLVCFSVLLQLLRTRAARGWMRQFADDSTKQTILHEFHSTFGLKMDKGEFEEFLPVLSMRLLLGRIDYYAHLISGYQWGLARCPQGCTFHMSDNPVVPLGAKGGLGIGQRGLALANTSIVYPVTPGLCLSGLNGQHRYAGTVFVATTEFMRDVNRAQYESAERWVFSSQNDFLSP